MNETPVLFADWPEQPALVEKVKDYCHSGRIATRDDARCEEIMRAVLTGESDRSVARRYQVARETIKAIRAEFEKAGKLRPLKERIVDELVSTAALALDNSIEMLEAKRVPPNVLPIMVGVYLDKAQGLMGLGEGKTAAKEGGPPAEEWLRRFEAACKQLREERAQTIDVNSESVESSPKPPIIHP